MKKDPWYENIYWFFYRLFKYKLSDWFEMPVKRAYWKYQCFKGIEVYPWDCVDMNEIIFAKFEYYCKNYPDYFITQAIAEQNGAKQLIKDGHHTEEDPDFKYNIYMRCAQIQEYVLHTRKLNEAKLEFISDQWHDSYKFEFVDSAVVLNGEKCSRLISEHAYYYNVDWWFENGELMYTMGKVLEKEKYFNPLDIEDNIQKVDTAYAKEILDWSGYIWN